MKVSSSTFLSQKKILLKQLLERLCKEYDYASVLASDTFSKTYRVSKRGTVIAEDSLLSTRGYVIKVYDGKGYAEYSFNCLEKDNIEDILKKIRKHLIPLSSFLPGGVTESEYAHIPDEPMTLLKSTEYEEDPILTGDEKIIEKLTAISEKGRAYDKKIADCNASIGYQYIHKMFLSPNRDLEQNILWTNGSISALASKGEEIKDYYKSFSCLGGTEILDQMMDYTTLCCKNAIELLDSAPITPGLYDCVCTPDVTGMIVHEAFGHGVEMDMFVKNRALAKQYIGEYVASPLVTMHDGACAAKQTATFFFDDEGTLAHDTVIIENGILKQGISDAQSAMHLHTKPTGNGRRESFERKAYTRMTNTYFEGGKDSVEDMISSISYGFLLDNPSSGMEDPKNWGIQCMVNVAREIKDGKLTGRIFSPIVLTGYVPDLLKSITMMSDTVELGGGGFCGKGYKEWVKVSDGGPYMKAKIRLG
ncbi:MAG: TldD/PmbA family protein [Lachnospiraceae bacterium]|nr:TldD/PmbA family protein [Lachnospiraceae bacterium]